MLCKNTSISAVDCGGRMVPEGGTADLDPNDPVIADHLAAGRLTPVAGQPPDRPATAAASKTTRES